MTNKEYEFEFEVTITTSMAAIVTETEWQEAQEYGDVEYIETIAREKAERRAAKYLTMEIADSGISDSQLTIGEVKDRWEFEF